MDKRYQVFVSSTFEDLLEERREVTQSLLIMDCIPTGMELFPAANEDSWTHIQRFIKGCDYYLVIVGGRYGSVSAHGKSYTEMEYDYAAQIGLPTLAFLHKSPGTIIAAKTEADDKGKAALAQFRAKIESARHAKYWESSTDLALKVTSSMLSLMKTKPAVGWVRGDQVPDQSSVSEILTLKRRVEELERMVDNPAPPAGTDQLAQGKERYRVHFTRQPGYPTTQAPTSELFSWNEILTLWGPLLFEPKTERALAESLETAIKNRIKDRGTDIWDVNIRAEDFHQVKLQLRALGLIKEHQGAWRLTPYGDHLVTNTAALRSAKRRDRESAEEAAE